MTHLLSSSFAHLLTPISATAPCGHNMEYSPSYMALMAAFLPKEEVQYGSFIDTPEGPNWSDIHRDCVHLLTQTKDIQLLIIWIRAQTRLNGLSGLRESLQIFIHLLQQFPAYIHPLPMVDGEEDLQLRANALSQFIDPEGLLKDIRDITFAHQSRVLTLKDVERAFMVPLLDGALPVTSVQQQIVDLYRHQDQDIHDLLAIAELIQSIMAWSQQYLSTQHVDLTPLHRLFLPFQQTINNISTPVLPVTPTEKPLMQTHDEVPQSIPLPHPAMCGSRQDATASLKKIREWYEINEPSSPVSVLLWQAEKLIGKRFYEVAQSIPLDVLERWEKERKKE